MKNAIVLEGPKADWAEHEKASEHVVDESGEVNWRAAMCADPGVMSCPKCNEYLWREGWRVRCPTCSHEFMTDEGKRNHIDEARLVT